MNRLTTQEAVRLATLQSRVNVLFDLMTAKGVFARQVLAADGSDGWTNIALRNLPDDTPVVFTTRRDDDRSKDGEALALTYGTAGGMNNTARTALGRQVCLWAVEAQLNWTWNFTIDEQIQVSLPEAIDEC